VFALSVNQKEIAPTASSSLGEPNEWKIAAPWREVPEANSRRGDEAEVERVE
jgi:hypothetical protein